MNDQRGVKRLCATCGTRFYDLLNKPICPKCKTEFIIPAPPPPRRPARPQQQRFQPAPIVAGSSEDVPEVDDEAPIATSDDDEDASENREEDVSEVD